MKKVMSLLLVVVGLGGGPALGGPRAAVDVSCDPLKKIFTYVCELKLYNRKTKQPISGAKIEVKMDMPSMPMAHNVPPVEAAAGDSRGKYTANLELEMYGEWTMTMDVSGPFRDRVINKLHFGRSSVTNLTKSNAATK